MKKTLILALIFSCLVIKSYSQNITNNLTTKQADGLRDSIGGQMADPKKFDGYLRLAMYNILKPGSEKSDMDSAAGYINLAQKILPLRNPEYSGYLNLVKSHLFREKGQRQDGKISAEKALSQLNGTNDKYHLALSYFELAQYSDDLQGLERKAKIKLLERAIFSLEGTRYLELKAFMLKDLAELYSSVFQSEKAMHLVQLSLDTYKSIGYKKLQGVYTLFGALYYEAGNYHKALSNLLLAQRTAERLNDQSMQMCQIYNIIGVTYGVLSERKNGIPFFKKALNIAKLNHDEGAIALLLMNIVDSYNKLADYRNALVMIKQIEKENPASLNSKDPFLLPLCYLRTYNNLKEFDKAKKYAEILLKLKFFGMDEVTTTSNISHELTRYYTFTHNYKLADYYLKKTKSIAQRLKDPFKIRETYYQSFKLDSVKGNYKQAINNLLSFRKISDSLFNESKSKQIKQLEIQYETEQKESEIRNKDHNIVLLKQKNMLQQMRLQKANLVRNVTIAGIAVLLIIVLLMVRQFRHKQHINAITLENNILITKKMNFWSVC
ncbi:tetratricopeptide repeat protein [Pedobacter jamesrossensis]|uniref:tetratricopeptide repeat protein n=1 Tax=Pedobacter jamesrossensis TaxID=1908238 RepID=UPI00360F4ED6